MIKVAAFTNETEAHLAKDFLLSHEIKAAIVGSKEYTAHILGGGEGHFELMVDPINLVLSQTLLNGLNQNTSNATPTNPNHFRRAVIFAFVAAFILPLIFNYASLVQAGKYWQRSDKGTQAVGALVFIGLLQLMPVVLIALLLRSYTHEF